MLEGTQLSASYTAHVLVNGTVFASAGVRDAGIGASYANAYAPSQNGARTASVIVSFDATGTASGGYFTVELDRTTLVTVVTYRDTDVAGGFRTWSMQPSACVANNY
jgi:hypothetical protein